MGSAANAKDRHCYSSEHLHSFFTGMDVKNNILNKDNSLVLEGQQL